MAWIQKDLDNRKEYISQLMSKVRLALLTQEYLVQRVEDDSLVKGNSDCKVRIFFGCMYSRFGFNHGIALSVFRTI